MFEIYLIIGALAGMLAGMLGVGGGIIVVPALAAIFLRFNLMPAEYAMHMAIGTSLATIMVTLLSALRSQVKHGTVRWELVKQFMPWLILGALLGAGAARYISSVYLKNFFGIFLIYIAYRLLFTNTNSHNKAEPSVLLGGIIATFIGILCSLLGAGGGTMLVPFLLRYQMDMREATATSTACSVGITFISTLSFMMLGMSIVNVEWSTGYIYWPAFLGITVSSVLFAPIGTMVAYRLPVSVLKTTFSIFLFLIAVDMLIPA